MNKITLTVVALLVCVSAYAVFSQIDSSDADSEYSGKCGDDVKFEFDPITGVLSITGTGPMANYVGEYGQPWSLYKENIRSVVITGSVSTIGSFDFYGCSEIVSVTLPETIVSIGEYAFCECSDLASVTIGNSVTSIGAHAFKKCISLTSVTISDSVTELGSFAFGYCTSLTTVTIGKSVTTIGDDTFRDCTSLTTISVNAENTKYHSEDGVLFDKALTELIMYPAGKSDTTYTIPSTVTSIGDYAFCYCSELTSVAFGNSVRSIGDYAFYNCSKLAFITFSDSVTDIGEFAFNECTSLTSVTIPKAVATIGYSAFRYCTALTSVTIPKAVATIGKYAFDGCPSLISITVDADNANYSSVDGALFNNAKSELIQYPASKTGDSYTIPDSVTTIGDYAFGSCSNLASVTIGNNVTSIGICVFSDCTSLTSIVLGNGITTIEESTFNGCYKLAYVTFGNSVTIIGASAFNGCTALTSITIPETVETIGYSAFFGCASIASINIPGSVTLIGAYAFRDCTSLATITVDSKNEKYCSVDGVLFDKEKTELIQYPIGKTDTSYTVPESVTSIGDHAFYDCSKLTSVTLGNSVENLQWCAFNGCTSLTSITIPSSVIYIDFEVFYGCTSLTEIKVDAKNESYCSVDGVLFDKEKTELIQYPAAKAESTYTIPDSVMSVRESAFYGCSKLTSVTISGLASDLGNSPFSGSTSLTTIIVDAKNETYSSENGVLFDKEKTKLIKYPDAKADTKYTIPDTVKTIGLSAFHGCIDLTVVTIPASVTFIDVGAFDGDFYDTDCQTKLEPNAKNLAGSTVMKVGDNWMKCVYSGKCGDNVTFDFDTTSGTLTIEGSGKMYDFTETSMPWNSYKDAIINVNITDSVESIGSYAFYNCFILSSVTIPASVTMIGDQAFSECTLLLSIDVNTANTKYSSVDGVLFDKDKTTLFLYPACKSVAYTIPDSVITIGKGAFRDCSLLISITIPASVKTIGDDAFYGEFYDADGKTKLDATAENLAGYTFNKDDGKWIKQSTTPSGDGSDDKSNTAVYVIVGIIVILVILAAVVFVKKRNA